ncbi:hypothetical protein V6615_07395 [Oscillospiraceae bacterium PP1C4]
MKYSPILDQVNILPLAGKVSDCPELVVQSAENSFRQKIIDICDTVTQEQKHMILVTGPSASGKTTSANKIAEELRTRGKKVNSISLDNFYVDAQNLPKWKDGYQNYESIEGLDIRHFEETVSRLLKTGSASLPVFDFSVSARTKETIDMTFDEQTYLIIEGIHALNPIISRIVDSYASAKIYISVHSEFTDDSGNTLLTARDLRLIRRILRDFTYRDTTAEETFRMWDYVLMGEDLYIRPFRRYADFHIDSTHAYEPYLYHKEILCALRETNCSSPYCATIQRLKASAERFFEMDRALIPSTSLIREFMKP